MSQAMRGGLHPVTAAKLDRIARRRRRMVIIRGVCAAVVTYLIAMAVISFADWRWVLSSQTRWALSLAGYAAVAAVVYLTCLRRWREANDPAHLARGVEAAEPTLREQLLAAIELGFGESPAHGSPRFRQLLQEQVAGRMRSLDVRRLLPWGLLARWLAAALLVVAACAALLSLPGFSFRQLMTRAMLPGANIDRISRTGVRVVEPSPASNVVPVGETVAVVIETFGEPADRATLEVSAADEAPVEQEMRPAGERRFATNVHVDSAPLAYRILAGDAVTRWHRLDPRPRPAVEQFEIRYRYPAYARLPERTVESDDGALSALRGSRAEVRLTLNEDVSHAEIHVHRAAGEPAERMPLSRDAEDRYSAVLPITHPASYRVDLVAAETGFDNPMSPRFAITPVEDRPPRITWTPVPDTPLLVPPNDLLPLGVAVEDELPLVELVQEVSINEARWERTELPRGDAPTVTAEWDWDLIDLDLSAGDRLRTRVVAIDRKGQRGESAPIDVVIASTGFDRERHERLWQRLALAERIAGWADSVAEHGRRLETLATAADEDEPEGEPEADEEEENADAPPADQAERRRQAIAAADALHEESETLLREVLAVLPEIDPGIEAAELELAARLVSRIRYEGATLAAWLEEHPVVEEDEDARNVFGGRPIAQRGRDAAESAEQLDDAYRLFVGQSLLTAIAEDFRAIADHQDRLVNSGVPLNWQRLERQQTVALNQLAALDRLISQNLPHAPEVSRSTAERMLGWVADWQRELEPLLESEESADKLKEQTERIAREFQDRRFTNLFNGRLVGQNARAHKELDRRSGSPFDLLDHLARAADEREQAQNDIDDTEDAATADQARERREAAARRLAHVRPWADSQLRTWGVANQFRRDGNAQFTADTGLTRRAAQFLTDAAETDARRREMADHLAEVAAAYRVLEAGHHAIQVRAELEELGPRERWEAFDEAGRMDNPRAWEWLHRGLELAVARMRQAGIDGEVVGAIDRLRWNEWASAAGKKITERRWQSAEPVSAARDLDQMAVEFDAALLQLEPVMDEARARIARHVPSIPELARDAANQLRELSEQTAAAAEQAADQAAEQADDAAESDEAERLEDEQQRIAEQIEALFDALVEDANLQDMMTDEGRERARDADDSIALVSDPAEAMQRAMDQAARAEAADAQADSLQDAAEAQQQTQNALDAVAEHYERLEAGQQVADSRAALREAEQQRGIAQEMDERFEPADELTRMASADPQDLLQQLEAELQVNEPMRESLADIAREAAEQARNALKKSAQQEAESQREIENSDADFQARKRAMVAELRDLADAASSVARTFVAGGDSAAARGKADEARESMQAARQALEAAAKTAREADDSAALDDLREATENVTTELAAAAEELAEARRAAADAQDDDLEQNDQQRDNTRRQLEGDQRKWRDQRIREARDSAKRVEQELNRSRQEAKKAENQLRSAEEQLRKAEREASQKPDNEGLARRADDARAKREQASAAAERANRQMESNEQRHQRAQAAKQTAEKTDTAPLDKENPGAELASHLAQQAAQVTEQLQQDATRIAENSEFDDQLRPDAGKLQSLAEDQQRVRREVARAAEDLRRAGRHAEREGLGETSEALQQIAEATEQAGTGELAGAEQRLEQASAAAAEADEAGAADGSPPARQASQSAVAARDAVHRSEQALTAQAEAVDALLQADAAFEPEPLAAGQASEPPSGRDTPSGRGGDERGQQLAQTLDELDRSMNASEPLAGEPLAGEPSDQPSASPDPTPQTLRAESGDANRRMAADRTRTRLEAAQLEAAQPSPPSSSLASGTTETDDASGGGELAGLARARGQSNSEWAQLREQTSEDLAEGDRESVGAEYRREVETYFRVIAERGRGE